MAYDVAERIGVVRDIKSEILNAAAECFSKNGSDATSIDDIARYMGATKGKVYHHYASKGELICAVRLRSVTLTYDLVYPFFSSVGSPEQRIQAMARAHVRAMLDNLAYHRVVVEAMRAPKLRPITPAERKIVAQIRHMQGQYHAMYQSVIEDGIDAGVFEVSELSVAVQSIVTLMISPVNWYRPKTKNTSENKKQIMDQIAQMVVGAVRK